MPTISAITELKSYEISLLINRGQRAFNELLKTCLGHNGLTVSEWTLLGQLTNSGDMRPNELADFLGVRPPFITTLQISLTKKGFIESVPVPDDERSKQIRLTGQGSMKVAVVEKKIEVCINEQLSSLESSDLNTYFAVCDYMMKNVRHTPIK